MLMSLTSPGVSSSALRALRKFEPMESCHNGGTHEPVAQKIVGRTVL